MLDCLAEAEIFRTARSRKMFEPPLTAEEQYWAGLIHADGSISRVCNSMRFAQKDEAPVRAFLDFLGQDSKISVVDRVSNFGRNVMYSATTSKGAAQLREMGVKGVPCQYLLNSKHFWRGMIDGDGSVAVSKNSYPNIQLCGSLSNVTLFSEWCAKVLGYRGPSLHQHKVTGVWYTALGAGKAKVLGLYLYENEYSVIIGKRTRALSFRACTINTKAAVVGDNQ